MVGQEVVRKAVERFGHYVSVWWAIVDDLRNVTWNPRLLSGRGLGVAVGVALMRTTAPGRYAVVMILPEPGASASPSVAQLSGQPGNAACSTRIRELIPSSNSDALVRYSCDPLNTSEAGKSSVAAPVPE